jgi:hypothetical protein
MDVAIEALACALSLILINPKAAALSSFRSAQVLAQDVPFRQAFGHVGPRVRA